MGGRFTFHWDGAPVDAIVIEGCEDASLVLQRTQAQTWIRCLSNGMAQLTREWITLRQARCSSWTSTTMLTVPLQVANDGFSEGIEDVLIVGLLTYVAIRCWIHCDCSF